jgi:hypothetical protein
MSTMATRKNEIKGITSHVHQHLDVIMKKINCIEGKLDTFCTRHILLCNQSNKGSGRNADLQVKENDENHKLSACSESRYGTSPSIDQEIVVYGQKEINKEPARALPTNSPGNGSPMFTLKDFPPLSRNDRINKTENVSHNQQTEVTPKNTRDSKSSENRQERLKYEERSNKEIHENNMNKTQKGHIKSPKDQIMLPNDEERQKKTDTSYRHIDTIITRPNQRDIESNVFEPVVRNKIRRILLSNVKSRKNIDVVRTAIATLCKEEGVTVTFVRLIKERPQWDGSTIYTFRLNILDKDFEKMMNNESLWSSGIKCREWISNRKWRENYPINETHEKHNMYS